MIILYNPLGCGTNCINVSWWTDWNGGESWGDPIILIATYSNDWESSGGGLSDWNGSVWNLWYQNWLYTVTLYDQNTGEYNALSPKLANSKANAFGDAVGAELATIKVRTLANSRNTIFAGRFPVGEEGTYLFNPPPVSLSFGGQLSIADLVMKFSLNLDSRLSIARRGPIDQPSDLPLFDLLALQVDVNRNVVKHYTRRGTSGNWKPVDTLGLPDGAYTTAVSHIQSFSAQEHLNALAWLQPSGTLVTFMYKSDTGEHAPIAVVADNGPVTGVNGTPALLQTDQKFFHLLVPLLSDAGQQIVHLTHTNGTMLGPWKQVATLTVPGGGSVLSVTAAQADRFGSLNAVARIRLPGEPDFLVSYHCDPAFNWVGPFSPIPNAVGSPGLVQSIADDRKESLNLVAPIVDTNTGNITLTQFSQPAIQQSFQVWESVTTLPPLNMDSRTQVVSVSLIQDIAHNLQAIANVITADGQNLLVFYIFNAQTGWSQPSVVTSVDGTPIVVGQNTNQPPPTPSLSSLTLNPTTVLGVTNVTSTGTVTLSSPALTGGALITLASQNPQYVTVPASVTVVEGQTTATFAATVAQVVVGNPNDLIPVQISATLVGVTQTATLMVDPVIP